MITNFASGKRDWRLRPGRAVRLGLIAATVAMMGVTGCSSSNTGSPTSAGSESASATGSTSGSASTAAKIPVALILKEREDPYYAFMEKALKQEADKLGIDLTVLVGKSQTDTADQINQVEDAVSAGNKGILITVDGDAVNAALTKARKAGVFVAALDTAPTPLNTADISFLTNPVAAGKLIGQWTAAKLGGKPADIALLDAFANVVVAGDVQRNHGFLEGMGIPVGDDKLNGKEPKSGNYTGGKGGTYTIGCQLASNGTVSGGQSAMETCLSKDPNINVVYAVNEPAAVGAANALKAANNKTVSVVAIDGSCDNLAFVKSGQIAATAGQFPAKMAELGAKAVVDYVRNGTKPAVTPGLEFYDSGSELFTDDPQAGVPSIDTEAAAKVCW